MKGVLLYSLFMTGGAHEVDHHTSFNRPWLKPCAIGYNDEGEANTAVVQEEGANVGPRLGLWDTPPANQTSSRTGHLQEVPFAGSFLMTLGALLLTCVLCCPAWAFLPDDGTSTDSATAPSSVGSHSGHKAPAETGINPERNTSSFAGFPFCLLYKSSKYK